MGLEFLCPAYDAYGLEGEFPIFIFRVNKGLGKLLGHFFPKINSCKIQGWEVVGLFSPKNNRLGRKQSDPGFFSAASRRCRLKVVPEEELPRVDEVDPAGTGGKGWMFLTFIINKHCLLHEPILGYFSYCSVFLFVCLFVCLFCFVLFCFVCLFFFRCE